MLFPHLKYIVLLGAIVQLAGIWSYAKDTLRGKTKPNRISWLLWSIAPLIATGAALSAGVSWAALPVFMSGFGPLLVFFASLLNRNAYWKLGGLDWLCGTFSVAALLLWGITKQPNVTIIFALASDAAAALPTLIKSWKEPDTETVDPYSTGIFSAFTSFAAIDVFNFAALAFPVYLIIMNSTLVLLITRKKFSSKKDRE